MEDLEKLRQEYRQAEICWQFSCQELLCGALNSAAEDYIKALEAEVKKLNEDAAQ